MTSVFGYSDAHCASVICWLANSVNFVPFFRPVTASPFAWRHHDPVALSSNIALKWSMPTSRNCSAFPSTIGLKMRPVRHTVQKLTSTGVPPTVSRT